MRRKHAGLLQSLGALQCDLKWPDTKTSATLERKGLHHPNSADSCPRTHCLPVPSKLVNFLHGQDVIFFFFKFFFCLSQCNLVGFSEAALHLHVDVQQGLCFLFWRSKINIPSVDLYIAPSLCLKIFVYSSANMQADHSNQKQQILPGSSKMHLAEGSVWKCFSISMKHLSFCLALEMCTQL